MFQVGNEFAKEVISHINHISFSDEEDFCYKGAMLFFFCKAYKTYQAIQILWDKGFQEDAFILARTIFEIALQAQYMRDDPRTRARLFTEHDPVMRYRYYKKMNKHGLLNEMSDNRKKELDELEKHYNKLKDNYPEHKGWWGKSIAWLAEDQGDHMKKRYDLIYWIQSNLVHSATTSFKDYLKEQGEGFKINCNPSISNDEMIPQEATLFFMRICELVCHALAIDKKVSVNKWYENYKEIFINK